MIFAAITQEIQPAQPDPLNELRDNAQEVDVPWPAWVWCLIGLVAVVVIGALVWLGFWIAKHQAKVTVLTPREIALRDLERLRARLEELDPYAFSVAVSDILRRFISSQFRIRATQQTSQEFLAELSQSTHFLTEDRELLGAFLERCDLLKFARVAGQADENRSLLEPATAFVQGASK